MFDRLQNDQAAGCYSFQLPGSFPHYLPDQQGHLFHVALNLYLDIPNRSLEGSSTLYITPIRANTHQLTLDAVNLIIDCVMIDQIQQPFDYDGKRLYIRLNKPTKSNYHPFELTIAYRAEAPRRGIYFIAPDVNYPHKPTQVWTQGENQDSRFWFPCFDQPGQLVTSEIRVRVPDCFLVISNGELISTESKGNDKIYHWHQPEPHPVYLMTLAVGEFAEIRDEWRGKPVTYYVEPSRAEQARLSLGKTPAMIEFFSQKYGYLYPYSKYAQVCVEDFIFGGMENTSATLLTNRCLLDQRAAIDNRDTECLVAHEMAHQWFGNLVVIKHWSHAWVKEGMATYAEVLWTEQAYGGEEAAYYRFNLTRSYLEEYRDRYSRPIVTHIYRQAIELYDRHLYEKGACVYHMLRAELGENMFWQAIATFVNDNAYQTVETVDLLRAVEKVSGRNLLFLFDQYVFRGGHPDFKVIYTWEAEGHLAKLTINQQQVNHATQSDLFDLKVPIAFGYINYPGQSEVPYLRPFTLRIYEKEQNFYVPLEQKPDFVSFDTGNHILKTVNLEYPLPELKAQLQHDPDPISRIYAAIALAKKGGLGALQALAQALKQELFWGVRAEIAKHLPEIKLDQVLGALLPALEDPEARVRRAAVEALAKIPMPASYAKAYGIAEAGDASYYVEAAALQALGGLSNSPLLEKTVSKTLELVKTVLQQRQGWNEVVRSGAMQALGQMKDSETALHLIFDYTAAGIAQPLRLAAIRQLGIFATGQAPAKQERILDRLEALSREDFFLTQVAVVAALEKIQRARAITILQNLSAQALDGRVRRYADEAIRVVQKAMGSDQATDQLRQELETLKQENQQLRSRLEKLEAKVS